MIRSLDGHHGIAPQYLFRRVAKFLGIWFVASAVLAGMSGCAATDWVDKHKEPTAPRGRPRPGEPVKNGEGGSVGPGGLVGLGWLGRSMIKAPDVIDFGDVLPDIDSQQMVVFSNPAAFDVTVAKVTIDGAGFARSDHVSPLVIPARGQLALPITFRPAGRKRYSASLWLEIDSVGGRMTQVRLRGRGVRPSVGAALDLG